MNNIKLEEIPVVILAGGLGTRLRTLFSDIPKIMAEVKGKPFLEWVLLYLKGFGFSNFIISSGYLSSKIEDYFASGIWQNRIRFIKEDIPLGTGGAVIFASKQINIEDFMVINGDSINLLDFKKFIDIYSIDRPDILIAIKRLTKLNRYGIVNIDRDKRVTGFIEKGEPIKDRNSGFVNTGIYIFSKKILKQFDKRNDFPFSLERDMIPALIKGKNFKIMAFESKGDFIDIGTPESFKMAEDFLERNIYKIIGNLKTKFF